MFRYRDNIADMCGIFIYRDTVYCELQYKTYVACGELGVLDWYTVNMFYSIRGDKRVILVHRGLV